MKHDLLRLSGSICPDKAGGSICCLTTVAGPAYLLDPLEKPTCVGWMCLSKWKQLCNSWKVQYRKKCQSHLFFLWQSLVAGLSWKGGTWPAPDAPGSTDHACSLLLQVSASIYKATSPFITVVTLCLVLFTAVSVPCP